MTILAHAILSKQLYFSPQHTQKKSYLNLLIPTMMTCERVANLALAGDCLCFLCNEKLGLFFFFQIFIRVMKFLFVICTQILSPICPGGHFALSLKVALGLHDCNKFLDLFRA